MPTITPVAALVPFSPLQNEIDEKADFVQLLMHIQRACKGVGGGCRAFKTKAPKPIKALQPHPLYHSSINEQTVVVCFTARTHHPRLCPTNQPINQRQNLLICRFHSTPHLFYQFVCILTGYFAQNLFK